MSSALLNPPSFFSLAFGCCSYGGRLGGTTFLICPLRLLVLRVMQFSRQRAWHFSTFDWRGTFHHPPPLRPHLHFFHPRAHAWRPGHPPFTFPIMTPLPRQPRREGYPYANLSFHLNLAPPRSVPASKHSSRFSEIVSNPFLPTLLLLLFRRDFNSPPKGKSSQTFVFTQPVRAERPIAL